MVKLKNVVAAAIVFVAAGAMASNFRVADQVYVPAAGHIGGSSGTFISDVFISNLTTDPVSVSVIYASTAAGTQATFANIIQLAAGERREIVDFFPTVLGLQTGFGQLIFNGCKQGGNCTAGSCPGGDPVAGSCPDFRNISVESRIYSIPPGTTLAQNPPTNGQLFSGIPWYNFVSSEQSAVGLDKVFITGLRNNAGYRGNVGLVNASQFSTTTLVVKLFNGLTGAQIGSTFQTTLAPLGHTQQNLGVIFPAFTGTTATNAYLTVEQTNTISVTPPDPGCPTGCPAFFAYGSVLDNQSGDATTLEPQFLVPLSDKALTCIYNPTTNCKTAVSIHRAVKH